MKDFSCCGLVLPTMHELVQHYEDNHTDQVPPSLQKHHSNQTSAPPDSKAAIAAGAALAVQGQGRVQQQPPQIDTSKAGQTHLPPQTSSTPVTPRISQQQAQTLTCGFELTHNQENQDDDAMGDMEMDDALTAPSVNVQQAQYPIQNQARIMPRSQFGQTPSNRVPPLDMNALNRANPLQHQGLRNSQPTTPVSAARNGNVYQNNPTVSSVNTPTLSTHPNPHPLQQQYYTPESSAPGTPGELDPSFVGSMGNMSMGNMQFMPQQDYSGYGYGNGNDMPDLCIDDPAKRLFSLNGGVDNPQQPPTPTSATQLGDAQYSENSELAKTIREQQKLAGVPDPSADGGVPKPFHCPVLGCEKAYKNQNGLKYHKSVSICSHPAYPPLLIQSSMVTTPKTS